MITNRNRGYFRSNINDAIFPNIVIPRTADNRFVLAHSFMAFPTGDDALVNYNHGDIRSAVGDFIGSGSPQIAVAQGVGGNGIVRLYQYTGRAAPFGYEVVGQFSGLPLNLIARATVQFVSELISPQGIWTVTAGMNW